MVEVTGKTLACIYKIREDVIITQSVIFVHHLRKSYQPVSFIYSKVKEQIIMRPADWLDYELPITISGEETMNDYIFLDAVDEYIEQGYKEESLINYMVQEPLDSFMEQLRDENILKSLGVDNLKVSVVSRG